MTNKVTVKKGEFPGTGEALIFIARENEYRTNKTFVQVNEKTQGKLLEKCERYDFKGKEGEIVFLELDDFYKLIVLVGVGKNTDFNQLAWRKAIATGFHTVKSAKLKSATLFYWPRLGSDFFEIGKNLSLSLHMTNYAFVDHKSEESRKKMNYLHEVVFIVDDTVDETKLQSGLDYGVLISKGIYLTRDLVNQPASHIHPEDLEQEAFRIEKESKGSIKVEILDEDECKRLGMGAFLGVAQGSDEKPKFIVLKTVRSDLNKVRPIKKVCLIGKSITFDSGGLSLKPSEFMETMKMDMAGGATVLGIFNIFAHANPTYEVGKGYEIYGILPACENMPSGKALRPGDIVTALNKKTIEVLNTDAEGRLTLADAISYAEEYIKPDMIIDIATLTGACMAALGRDITGMFGNDKQFNAAIEKSALNEGEELWQLPLYKPYAKQLKSDIADLKNIGGGRYGGAITAALFLAEFVKKAKWIHLDIAGSAFNEGSPQGMMPKGGTGWGILTLIEYLKSME